MGDNPKDTMRNALITGGGRRIGAAIARALVRAGYSVVLHANNSRDDAEKLAAAIEDAGGKARVVLADLADHDSVRALVPAAAVFGKLTLLVNNAGEFEPDDIETMSHARFQRAIAVNLEAPLFLSQAFAAQAPAGVDASIVNIVDQRVLRPNPRFFSYTLSKSALFTATTTLAQAFAPKLRVNAVAPGPTLPSPRQTDAQFAAQAGSLPLQRGPQPEDIAGAVVYLAQAASVTGVTIPVDGGQHLSWRTADSEAVE
ncbi:MAG TPA: SDR family oxidoreductase [Pseudolabrys sp.]|nr:SDR family oxidoreductase [Pseudolabrys sp.]